MQLEAAADGEDILALPSRLGAILVAALALPLDTRIAEWVKRTTPR
jgi:hypothetical protein